MASAMVTFVVIVEGVVALTINILENQSIDLYFLLLHAKYSTIVCLPK